MDLPALIWRSFFYTISCFRPSQLTICDFQTFQVKIYQSSSDIILIILLSYDNTVIMRKILRGVKMNKSKQLTEGALLTAVYIVLLLILFFIPVLQLVGIFVLPVPFAIYAAHHGWKPSIVMAFVALLLTAMFATIV